jgi:hypothetical protein
VNGDGSDGQSGTGWWPTARWVALTGFVACFALFALNVLFGSMAVTRGWSNALSLDRVTEFLVLFGSAIFLTLAALACEAEERATRPHEPND